MSDFRTWDELSEVEQLQCEYSDFYKDVHGFRPRGHTVEEWNSVDFLKAKIVVLATYELD